MLSKKYEIIIICQNVTNENVIELRNRNVDKVIQCNELPKLTYYSGGPNILSRTIISDLVKLRKRIDNLKKIIGKIEFDICIIYSLVLAPAIKSIPNEAKKILYIHETFKRNIISSLIHRFIEKNFSGLLAINQSELDFFKDNMIKRLIADVYLPLKSNSTHPPTKNILYMGGGDTIKGFYHIMKLSKKLPEGWKILFLGDFKSKPKINFIIHPYLKLKFTYYSRFINSKNIQKIGYIQDIGKVISKVSFGIFPSIHPHQPRPILELGFYNKTAIISDFKETEHFYKNEFNVLSFNHKKNSDLVSKIKMLIEDEKLMKYLANNNHFMSKTYHNFEIEKEKLLGYLELF
jgi:hypothetical protein